MTNPRNPNQIRKAILRRMEEALDLYAEGKLNKHGLKWVILGLGTAYTNAHRIRTSYYE